MMENDYQPDGWLGFIVGAKFWIDFKDRRKIQDGIERLLKEIKKTEKPEEEKMVKAVDVPDGGKEHFVEQLPIYDSYLDSVQFKMRFLTCKLYK